MKDVENNPTGDMVVEGVVLLTPDDMVEMAEHLLANSRRLRARNEGRAVIDGPR